MRGSVLRNSSEADVSTLWNDLSLGNLLDGGGTIVQETVNAHLKESACPNSVARERHKKMIEKPTFGVLMNRYQALPHDPIAIQPKAIDRLADPIRGRFTKYDRLIDEIEVPEPVEFSSPYQSRSPSRSRSPEQLRGFDMSRSPNKQQRAPAAAAVPIDSFFLTADGLPGVDNTDEESVQQQRRAREKQAVYARVKEILSPKRPSSNANNTSNNNNVASRYMFQPRPTQMPPKFQDPLIKALKKTMRPKGTTNTKASKGPATNNKRSSSKQRESQQSKFASLHGFQARKERKGGKMLHASQIKPLDKSKSESKLKSRQAWNNRLVPTEMLHKQKPQQQQQQQTTFLTADENENNNEPATTTAAASRRKRMSKAGTTGATAAAGGGGGGSMREKISRRPQDLIPLTPDELALHRIDEALGNNITRKKGKLPPFPAPNPDDNLFTDPKAYRTRRTRNNNNTGISDSENENDKVMQRCKSSAQLRADKLAKIANRVSATGTTGAGVGVLKQSSDLEDAVDKLKAIHSKDKRSSSNSTRNNGIRSAPSLLSGLQRVDEDPIQKLRRPLPGVSLNNKVVAATAAATGAQQAGNPLPVVKSTVRRKLISDILNSQQAQAGPGGGDEDGEIDVNDLIDNNNSSIPKRIVPSSSPTRKPPISNAPQMTPLQLDDLLPVAAAEGEGIQQTDAIVVGGDEDLMATTGGKKRSTAEILDSLEKIHKDKVDLRLASNKPKATKGTVAGTAEIEAETDEKAVERLLKFTKRFESKINAAETLSAEYKTLRNGGLMPAGQL